MSNVAPELICAHCGTTERVHYFCGHGRHLICGPCACGSERCPICGGNGKVDAGFYNQTSGTWASSSIAFEDCRSCSGRGYIEPDAAHYIVRLTRIAEIIEAVHASFLHDGIVAMGRDQMDEIRRLATGKETP